MKRSTLIIGAVAAGLMGGGVAYAGLAFGKSTLEPSPKPPTNQVGIQNNQTGNRADTGSSQGTVITLPKIDGMACDTMEGKAMHIHSHLDIYENGQPVVVPAGVGIHESNGCLYWLHTHDTTGVVHEESPEVKTFTLGEFFDVAGTHNFDHPDKVYINGKAYKGSIRNIPLGDHYEIVLEFGPKYVTPPKSFDFQGLQ